MKFSYMVQIFGKMRVAKLEFVPYQTKVIYMVQIMAKSIIINLIFVPYERKLLYMVQIESLSDSNKKKSVPYI